MAIPLHVPFPKIDALPLGAHRIVALTDEALFASCGVRILFTGREGGESEGLFSSLNTGSHVGDDPAVVERNRLRVLEAAGAQGAHLIVPSQVHRTDVVCVQKLSEFESACARAACGADGVIVGVPGVAALLNFADCLPLIIVSPSGRFAVVHAGWRGAVAGIVGKAVRLLEESDRYKASDYNAYIGPHIHSECFEVGVDVASSFERAFGSEVVDSERHVSLAQATTVDLVRAGMEESRIADTGICTSCHSDRFFSYRASNGACGRHAAFACNVCRRAG